MTDTYLTAPTRWERRHQRAELDPHSSLEVAKAQGEALAAFAAPLPGTAPSSNIPNASLSTPSSSWRSSACRALLDPIIPQPGRIERHD